LFLCVVFVGLFYQAEDGIRDRDVTGVQTCALPNSLLTTAFGLAIGIFAFVGYNLLVAKVDKVIYMIERTTTEFMDMLHE